MAALTIGGSGSAESGGKIDCDEMEWKFGGGNLFRKLAPTTEELDSDDDPDDAEADSTNPLKILATREVPSARKTKPASAESSANGSGAADVSKSPSVALKSDPSADVLYTKQISSKVDETKPKVRFIPFRSAETKPEKSKHRSSNPTRGLRHTPKSDRPIKNREIEVMPLPSENYSKASVTVR